MSLPIDITITLVTISATIPSVRILYKIMRVNYGLKKEKEIRIKIHHGH